MGELVLECILDRIVQLEKRFVMDHCGPPTDLYVPTHLAGQMMKDILNTMPEFLEAGDPCNFSLLGAEFRGMRVHVVVGQSELSVGLVMHEEKEGGK